MARNRVFIGTVIDFDSAIGLGELRDDAGESFRFHSTAISDGTRNTSAGIRVAFTLRRGIDGILEAEQITPFESADNAGSSA